MWCVREVDRKLTVRRKRERQRSHDADPSQPDGGDWEPPAHSGWVRDDDGERREALNCPRHSNDQRRAPRGRRAPWCCSAPGHGGRPSRMDRRQPRTRTVSRRGRSDPVPSPASPAAADPSRLRTAVPCRGRHVASPDLRDHRSEDRAGDGEIGRASVAALRWSLDEARLPTTWIPWRPKELSGPSAGNPTSVRADGMAGDCCAGSSSKFRAKEGKRE